MEEAGPGDPFTLSDRSEALRAKYHVGMCRIPPQLIAFHPANRGGQAPNGERCVELLKGILRNGYDPKDGDHEGILVQEAPSGREVQAFNDHALQGDPLLTPSIEGVAASYGSLSHSHLNQVFKNILGKLPLGVPEISTQDGRACLEVLRSRDAKMAKACEEGLLWEILSHKITTEESEGCELIQAAANSKHGVALTYHEMEVLNSLSRWCSSQTSDEISFQRAREAMGLLYPDMARDGEFVNMFKLVIDLGADKAPFLASLKEFTSKFVNPALRRLRPQAFSNVAALPMLYPRLKVAILKWTYSQEPKFGFCPSPDCGRIQHLPLQALETIESALQSVHGGGMASLIRELPDEWKRTQWLGNVDVRLASVVMEAARATSAATLASDVGKHLTAMCVKLATLLGDGGEDKVKSAASEHLTLVAWPGSGDAEAPSSSPTKAPLPKVIQYDTEGKPVDSQEEREKPEPAAEQLLVADWAKLRAVQNTHADVCALGMVCSALQVVQGTYAAKIWALPIEVMRCKGVVLVVARSAIKKGGLVLPVGTMSVNSLVPAAKCTHPRAVKVVLRETPDSARSGEHWPWLLTQREYMVTPELNLPKPPAIAGGAHLWKATSWAHLFWVIPRDDSEEKWNCELFHTEVTQAHALKEIGGGAVARAFSVSIPALRNTRAIRANEPIVLKWPKPKEAARPKHKTTWLTAAAKSDRAAKKPRTVM